MDLRSTEVRSSPTPFDFKLFGPKFNVHRLVKGFFTKVDISYGHSCLSKFLDHLKRSKTSSYFKSSKVVSWIGFNFNRHVVKERRVRKYWGELIRDEG